MKSSYAKRSGLIASAVALGLVLAACGSSSSSPPSTTAGSTGTSGGSSSGGNGAPIKIALIASLTGADAAQNGDSAVGFTSRIAAQNAKGGVNGHHIDGIVIDDQTSPSQVVIAVQQAISDGVTGIVSNSPLMFAAAKYAQQAGIPVTGGAFDGTEWGSQPNTNMFPADTENTNPASPWSKSYGDFFKAHGGTVVGTYGYGISPSSKNATYASAKSSLAAGLKVGVMDVSVQFGTESFGSEALAGKSAGINALTSQMDVNSDIALLAALKQNGVNPKVVSFATGYQDTLPSSNIWSTVQGVYFGASIRPWNIPMNAGTTAEKAALTKYGSFKANNFPDLGQNESYLGADLMILGLQKAGANPTSASVIKALRNTTDYNANGLLPVTLNYKINFGYNTHIGCEWYEKAETSGFVATSATPTCTPYIPGSTSLTPPKI